MSYHQIVINGEAWDLIPLGHCACGCGLADKPFQAVTAVAAIIPETPKTIRTEDGAATLRHDWDFEIVDPNLVERRFLVIDPQAIRREVSRLHVWPGVWPGRRVSNNQNKGGREPTLSGLLPFKAVVNR
jgi:hypothetical protein